MKTVFRIDNMNYEDFTEMKPLIEDSDYYIDVSLKNDDYTIYDISGFSGTAKLIFQNTNRVESGTDFEISGTVDDDTSIISFDTLDSLTDKGSNVFKTMLNIDNTHTGRKNNIYTGKAIIIKKLGD